VDRLPILITGQGVDKLLGVPKLVAGTGANTAPAVYAILEDWGVADQVKGCVSIRLLRTLATKLSWYIARIAAASDILAVTVRLCRCTRACHRDECRFKSGKPACHQGCASASATQSTLCQPQMCLPDLARCHHSRLV